MNKETYIEYLKNPNLLDSKTENELLALTVKYPFSQTSQILLYLNLLKNNNEEYKRQLAIAAIYCNNRKILKLKTDELLNATVEEVKEEISDISISTQNIAQNPISIELNTEIEPENKISANTQEAAEEQIIAQTPETVEVNEVVSENEIQALKDETIEFSSEDKANVIENKSIAKEIPIEYEVTEDKPAQTPNEMIIEKFIKEQPKIKTPVADKIFQEEEIDKNSLIENEDFVSETLALIYEKQRYYQKAIKIYEKLILENPEKSSFFANQIEKLKNISNQQ